MPENESLTVKIAEEIVAREGIKIENLQSTLYEVSNVDALEQLFQSADHKRTDTNGTVSFTYRDYAVTVGQTATVHVTSVTDGVEPTSSLSIVCTTLTVNRDASGLQFVRPVVYRRFAECGNRNETTSSRKRLTVRGVFRPSSGGQPDDSKLDILEIPNNR